MNDHANAFAFVHQLERFVDIIQLPDYYVQSHLESGRLVSILEDMRAPDDGIWAVYPHNYHLSPKVRLLLDHLSGELSCVS